MLEEGIATGRYKLIVGPFASAYRFERLALVVEDEEHKYGVLQREALVKKAAEGNHTISMSATPISRTLAQTIYSDGLELFNIRSKPAGRSRLRPGLPING